jgi:cytochrome c-type biogenesis protein CcmF
VAGRAARRHAVAGPNWTALEAELRASRGSGVTILKPQSRYFTDPPTETNEAAIDTAGTASSTPCSASPDGPGALAAAAVVEAVRDLIWLGGALIALGGAAGAGRPLVARERARRRRRARRVR